MTALPHKRISEAVWERDSDRVKLLVESGLDAKKQPIGVPYGSIARMILLYLQTQAVRTRSREVGPRHLNERLAYGNGHSRRRQDISDRARAVPPYQPLQTTFFRRAENAEIVTNGDLCGCHSSTQS